MVRSLRKSQELIWGQSRVDEGRWVEEEATELKLYRVLPISGNSSVQRHLR